MKIIRRVFLGVFIIVLLGWQYWCYEDAYPLVEACQKDDYERVAELLEEKGGRNINRASGSPILLAWAPELWPMTPLVASCRIGNEDIIKLLLEKGAKPWIGCGWGYPLNLLLDGYYPDIDGLVRELVNNGASVDTKNVNGETALLQVAGGTAVHNTVEEEKIITSTYIFFLNRAKIKNPHSSFSGENSFLKAARANNVTLTKYILDEGYSDINYKDKEGRTALFDLYVEEANNPDDPAVRMTKYLLERGIDTNIRDNEGMTALEYSRKEGYTEVVKVLEAAE